jgi:hypothetical protein
MNTRYMNLVNWNLIEFKCDQYELERKHDSMNQEKVNKLKLRSHSNQWETINTK